MEVKKGTSHRQLMDGDIIKLNFNPYTPSHQLFYECMEGHYESWTFDFHQVYILTPQAYNRLSNKGIISHISTALLEEAKAFARMMRKIK